MGILQGSLAKVQEEPECVEAHRAHGSTEIV